MPPNNGIHQKRPRFSVSVFKLHKQKLFLRRLRDYLSLSFTRTLIIYMENENSDWAVKYVVAPTFMKCRRRGFLLRESLNKN